MCGIWKKKAKISNKTTIPKLVTLVVLPKGKTIIINYLLIQDIVYKVGVL